MKKIKFIAWAFLFMVILYLPIPFAIAWGYKAIPVCIICGYLLMKIMRILRNYDIF